MGLLRPVFGGRAAPLRGSVGFFGLFQRGPRSKHKPPNAGVRLSTTVLRKAASLRVGKKRCGFSGVCGIEQTYQRKPRQGSHAPNQRSVEPSPGGWDLSPLAPPASLLHACEVLRDEDAKYACDVERKRVFERARGKSRCLLLVRS
jgi:hypothetical protein